MLRRSCQFAFALLLMLSTSGTAAAESPSWTSNGPYGGRIRAIAVSPQYPQDHSVFAATESEGLLHSHDGGATWGHVSGLPEDLAISSVAISPDFGTDRTMFVSTTQRGVFKSWDGGGAWSSWSDGLASLSIAEMSLSTNYGADQTAIAATDLGIYKTVSAGKRWYSVGPIVGALSVAISPPLGDHFTAFAGTILGMYVSNDSAETWEAAALNGVPVVAIALSPDYATDQTVLAGTLAGAYLSRDGGTTWGGPWLAERVVHHAMFSPDYTRDQMAMLGTDLGLYASLDGGETWATDGQIDDTVHALAASPDYASSATLFAGTDRNGVFFTEDGGANWRPRNRGITDRPMETVAVSPNHAVDRTVFAGGASGAWRSTDDGLSWYLTPLDFAEVNALAYSSEYASNHRVYAATRGGVFASNDGGDSWQPASGDLDVLNVLDLAVGPEDVLWIATAESGVYYSWDQGTVWERRSEGMGSAQVRVIEWLGAQDEGPSLLAGTWGMGVYGSNDEGLSWVPALSGMDTLYIHDLASAVGYGDRLWAFAGTTAGVFRSGDKGRVWDFAGLIGTDVLSIALHPQYAERPSSYVGSARDGVLNSANGGLTWQPLNDGLGNHHVRDLSVTAHGDEDEADIVLYAATQGGVWRYGPPPESPAWLRLPLVVKGHSMLTMQNQALDQMAPSEEPNRLPRAQRGERTVRPARLGR